MRNNRYSLILPVSLIFLLFSLGACRNPEQASPYMVGQVIDSLNGVYVYYNGKVGNVSGRNLTADNYNLGQKYQCVEFVKRYYYEYFDHKMPDSYGHAKDFFDANIKDGQKNLKRDLIQHTNPGSSKPKANDLLVFGGTLFNRYGHVAIIAEVGDDSIQIIQQNPGPDRNSREWIPFIQQNGQWYIDNKRVMGWLRKE